MNINAYFKKEWRVPGAIGLGAFVAGGAIGYFVAHRRYNVWTDEKVDALSEQLRLDFDATARAMVEDLGPIRKRYEALEDAVQAVSTTDVHTTVMVEETVTVDVDPEQNKPTYGSLAAQYGKPAGDKHEVVATEYGMLDGRDRREESPEWNQEEENENRSPDSPYVISRDEFHNGATPHRQTALEYFAGDDILCDEKRIPLRDIVKIVGRLEFGRGSGDPDIVYIRNEKLDSEFEVTRNPGTYQAEVLGLQAEEEYDKTDDSLAHSIPRFRKD